MRGKDNDECRSDETEEHSLLREISGAVQGEHDSPPQALAQPASVASPVVSQLPLPLLQPDMQALERSNPEFAVLELPPGICSLPNA